MTFRKSSRSDTNGTCVEVDTDFVRSSFCDSSACVEVGFRKSSYSSESANCVEVAYGKSSRSTGNGNCVEVGRCGCEVLVRDSKDPAGPVLSFAPAEWSAFIAGVKENQFDL